VAAWEREVRDLHRFFAAYFSGAETDIGRLVDALAPGFRMIGPDGIERDRQGTIAAVAASCGAHDVEIEIRAPRLVTEGPPLVVTYEEWQRMAGDDAFTGRVSTAVFEPDGDGVRWLHLHETWLPLR